MDNIYMPQATFCNSSFMQNKLLKILEDNQLYSHLKFPKFAKYIIQNFLTNFHIDIINKDKNNPLITLNIMYSYQPERAFNHSELESYPTFLAIHVNNFSDIYFEHEMTEHIKKYMKVPIDIEKINLKDVEHIVKKCLKEQLIPDIVGVFTILTNTSMFALEHLFKSDEEVIEFFENYFKFKRDILIYTKNLEFNLNYFHFKEIFNQKEFKNHFKYPDLIKFLNDSLSFSVNIYRSDFDKSQIIKKEQIEFINKYAYNVDIYKIDFDVELFKIFQIKGFYPELNGKFIQSLQTEKIFRLKFENIEKELNKKIKNTAEQLILDLSNIFGLPKNGDVYKTFISYITLKNLAV